MQGVLYALPWFNLAYTTPVVVYNGTLGDKIQWPSFAPSGQKLERQVATPDLARCLFPPEL